MAEEISFTQEQVDQMKQEWIELELSPIVSERDELLQFKPKDLSEDEKAMLTKQKELFDKEVSLEVKAAGLGKFEEFFVVESTEQLVEKIEKFQAVLQEYKVENSYVPTDHKQTNPYDKFEQEKNTKGMIGTKLANLFK